MDADVSFYSNIYDTNQTINMNTHSPVMPVSPEYGYG